MKHINVLEDVLIIGGTAVSLTMIQTILGIVILSCQVVLILIKAGIKIYNLIKHKKYDDAIQCIDETKDELEHLKENKDGKH